MSVAEMKLEVINKITNLNNEVVLQKVMALLEIAEGKETENAKLSQHYDAIKSQYGDVLQTLAP